jgi:AraC-like DNA-binding protein
VADTDQLAWILALVEESLDDPQVDGPQLAARACLSPFHFSRLVASALGEPPGTFRRRVLMERAAYHLASTANPVIELAWEAGYASPEGFSRAFSKLYGRSPSEYRRRGPREYRLGAANGVHFHPPGGLRLSPTTRRETMDVLTKMFDHHLYLVGEILDRCADVGDESLDRPITLSVEGIDRDPTLRRLAQRLVSQLEMWVAAISGATTMPPDGPCSIQELRQRLDTVGPEFYRDVIIPIEEGRADEAFVDAICAPPESFTFAGVLAHVLTFAAVRRTMAIGALESAGVGDLGSGDPMMFVGEIGADASTITRRRG